MEAEQAQVNAEDIALVEQALVGDKWAQRELVLRYQGPIFAYVYRWLRNRADAEDLTQDAFSKMFRALSSYSRKSSFRAWLYRIARNRVIDFLRRKKPRAIDVSDTIIESDSSPARTYEETSLKEKLNAAIATLPPIYREVLLLRHRDELSYEEIVDATELPVGTVKARLHRARLMLRDRLEPMKLL